MFHSLNHHFECSLFLIWWASYEINYSRTYPNYFAIFDLCYTWIIWNPSNSLISGIRWNHSYIRQRLTFSYFQIQLSERKTDWLHWNFKDSLDGLILCDIR